MNDVEQALATYVKTLEDKGSLTSDSVKRAFRRVRRHRFLDQWFHPEVSDLRVAFLPVKYDRDHPTPTDFEEIYSDQALVTAVQHSMPTSSMSQPSLVSRMLELLTLHSGMNTLEIGTGTGYNAALLVEVLGPNGNICTVDLQDDVARRARGHLEDEGYTDVRVFCRDGYLGVPEAAPFDRIVATVGCSDLSPHWLAQLSPEGFMLVPLRHGFEHSLVRVTRDPGDDERGIGKIVQRSSFMSAQGILASANAWKSYLINGLPEAPLWTRPLPKSLMSARPGNGNPLDQVKHRAFHFFLSLSSRELWWNARGYGLADPGSASILIVSHEGIEAYSTTGQTAGLDRLFDRFLFLAEEWDQLGQPVPEDYSLSFTPATRLEPIPEPPGSEWIIERPFFLEIVRLAGGDQTRKKV